MNSPEFSQQEPPAGSNPLKMETEWDDNKTVPGVHLKLDNSTYDAYINDGVFYTGMLKVPEEERRKGIGSKLLFHLIEIAKEYGINEIRHRIQSFEGLMTITNVLNQPNRKYYLGNDKEISFQEAIEILKKKRGEGKQDDITIAVDSSTYIDQLEK